ncbi:MAG: putative porin, partial [Sphingopyxis sp.]
MRLRPIFLAATALSLAMPAQGQDSRLDALERRIAEQDRRIADLEALVTRQSDLLQRTSAPAPVAPTPLPAPTPSLAAPATASAAPDGLFRIPGLDVAGDMRVRQEWNFVDGRDRSRTAVRARVRASYAVSDHFSVGTQIATGDPDDPNSTDLTLGNFVDDFQVSLDQAWIRYANGGFTTYAGKFPQQFQRTDMLWDGDVSPQGVAAAYGGNIGTARVDARGLW